MTDYPFRADGVWVARDFLFSTGEVFDELPLGYTTVGLPTGVPILILHGTTGTGERLLRPDFGGELFGPGQPLDASKYYSILPDVMGGGRSAKPSDGLRARFPRYTYDDMVLAQYRLVSEGLGVRHLRALIGESMGGMHAWMWGITYPDFMDILLPLGSQPVEMSGRNWMMRRLLVEAIKADPGYNGGDYQQPPGSMRYAQALFAMGTNGGTLALQAMAATRAKADQIVADRLAAPLDVDANDFIYRWEAARDYKPEPGLGLIKAQVLAINSEDDERNPMQTGLTEHAMRKLKNGRFRRIAASAETRGHGTTGLAKFWAADLRAILADAPFQT